MDSCEKGHCARCTQALPVTYGDFIRLHFLLQEAALWLIMLFSLQDQADCKFEGMRCQSPARHAVERIVIRELAKNERKVMAAVCHRKARVTR